MLVILLACVVSFVPSVALFLWLRNRLKKEETYKKLCNRTLLQGAMCMMPVLLLSGCAMSKDDMAKLMYKLNHGLAYGVVD